MDSLASTAAGLVSYAVYFGLFAASTWIGWKLSEKLAPAESENVGCALMGAISIAVFICLALIFHPAIEALDRVACKGSDDFSACMGYD
jgi:TRAP-type C4-dicarboxylate transport system permease small subunit